MKPTLIIMTGPQGSGNHLFSKAFGTNHNYWGWKSLQSKYWEGHDMEPFSQYWKNSKKLIDFNWSISNYFFTSISCPYFDNGVESIPKYNEFIIEAEKYANIKILIIGRDQTILHNQQQRVRSKHTTPVFLSKLVELNIDAYASQEMLYLYKISYLNSIETTLGIPTDLQTKSSDAFDTVLEKDANEKYITHIETNWLDDHIKLASSKKEHI